MRQHQLYRFESFCLDATAKVLSKDGRTVAITRKAVETLLVLVENSGQVVSKDELLRAIWPDRVVDEANLTQNIAMVRRALTAERGTPAYIETFPGRGYRLLGPVTPDVPEAPVAVGDNGIAVELNGAHAAAPLDIVLPDNIVFSESASPAAQIPSQSISPSKRSIKMVWMALALATLAAVGAGWFGWPRNARSSETMFRVSPFTRLPGKELQPALSPDGRRVAFLWDQSNGQPPDIRIQTAGENLPAQVTRTTGHYSSPAWSPDGRALAFLRIERSATQVLIASVEQSSGEQSSGEQSSGEQSSGEQSSGEQSSGEQGSGEQGNGEQGGEKNDTEEKNAERLVASFTPPNYGFQYRLLDWSPDGQWLAVSHPDSPDKPNGLFLVNVATGERRLLTKPEAMVGGDMDPRFSPDGSVVTFVRHIHRSHQEVYSVPITGGAPQALTADARQISGHDWMRHSNGGDGGNGAGYGIIFASDRGGEFRLWKIRAGQANPEKNPQALGIYAEFPIELSLARATSTLAYSVQQQDRNIWRLDLKEKRWTRVIASSAQDASPQYSPTGDRICFRSDRSGEEQLWVSDADGNNQTQITKDALYPSVGHWSPDGRRIVFNNARTGEMFFATFKAGTHKENWKEGWTVRGTGITGIHPVFSPDGQWIYAGASSSIIKLSAAGGAASNLVKTRGISLGVSPDGKLIYFMRDGNDSMLWQARTDTGEFTKAMDGVLPKCTSCWAVGQHGLYYLGSGKQSFDTQVIYFHDFATSRDREILKYPEPLAPVGSGPFSLSPDLRSLLCVRVDPSNSDIMRVEPFR